jgi:hypothetical protein
MVPLSIMRCRLWSIGVLALAAMSAGCSVLPHEDEKVADGLHCTEAAQCKSGFCTRDELCAASSCDCPGDSCNANGEHSGDCDNAALCVASTNVVEDIGQFFSGDRDNDGYCQLPCDAGCPEHFACGGDFCVPIVGWADPVPSARWSGAAEGALTGKGAEQTVPLERGKGVTLTASATSPSDASIASFAWTIVNESGLRTPSNGETVDVTIEPSGSFSRAELTVTDAKMRAGLLYVIFQGCSGAGDECGFQGSGCCNGCNDANNLCQ